MRRRSFLQFGLAGTFGLSLEECLRRRATAAEAGGGKHRNAIFIWLGGGPSHHDTFDPKPNATAEIRGEYKPIATSVAGIQVAESLPRLAKSMHHPAVIRSLTHADAAHEPGVALMQTGYGAIGRRSSRSTCGFSRGSRHRRNCRPPTTTYAGRPSAATRSSISPGRY